MMDPDFNTTVTSTEANRREWRREVEGWPPAQRQHHARLLETYERAGWNADAAAFLAYQVLSAPAETAPERTDPR